MIHDQIDHHFTALHFTEMLVIFSLGIKNYANELFFNPMTFNIWLRFIIISFLNFQISKSKLLWCHLWRKTAFKRPAKSEGVALSRLYLNLLHSLWSCLTQFYKDTPLDSWCLSRLSLVDCLVSAWSDSWRKRGRKVHPFLSNLQPICDSIFLFSVLQL